MDEKRRSKRAAKSLDDGFWECSVCTYRNHPDAFKCDMCDVRKGTSTRKPRLNAQLVAQQVAQQYIPPVKKEKEKHKHKDKSNHPKKHRPPRLKNIDRSSGQSMEVTVGNLTVIITDYKLKKERTSITPSQSADTSSQNTTANSSMNSSSSELPAPETPESSSSPSVKTEVNGDISTEES